MILHNIRRRFVSDDAEYLSFKLFLKEYFGRKIPTKYFDCFWPLCALMV